MGTELASATIAPDVVQTPDGPVTRAPIESLEQTFAERQKQVQELGDEIARLKQDAQPIQAQAGSILVLRRSEWASADSAAQIDVAQGMQDLVARLQQQISQLEDQPHHGFQGLVRGIKDRHDIAGLQSQLKSATVELDARYRAVADKLTVTGIADVDSKLAQAKDDLERAHMLSAQKQQLEEAVQILTDEIQRRRLAISSLGFDAPAVEAELISSGPRPVSTNLVLKRAEVAVASVSATLSRYRTKTHYVGGSQGFSIPLGHGIRYRVSSFRGQPIQVESLATVDQGNLVVTNQRLVFLGAKRDVSIPLAKLLQIEAFSNAVAIGREGKESRDIYLVANPAYVTLFLQWVVSHQA